MTSKGVPFVKHIEMHYFDNAATSWPKPEPVYEACNEFLRYNGASPGRSSHCLAKQADQMVDDTRVLLARFFNAPDPRQVAFTFNATDGLNLVIKGLLKPGDHCITTTVEHNSVSRPLRRLEREGVELTYLQADEEGFVHPEDLDPLLRPETKLVIMAHASNVLGAVQDIAELSRITHRHGATFALDAAQTAGIHPIDMQAMGIDVLIVPGHKSLLGPQGTGAVLTLRELDLPPWRDGGTGTRSDARLHPLDLPYRLEGGTLNAVGIAGLKAAVEFIIQTGVDTILKREHTILEQLSTDLGKMPGITLYGPKELKRRAGLLSFNVDGYNSDELAELLNDRYSIAGRPGLHCAPMAHRSARTFPHGSFRLSPGYFTKDEEVELVIKAMKEIAKK